MLFKEAVDEIFDILGDTGKEEKGLSLVANKDSSDALAQFCQETIPEHIVRAPGKGLEPVGHRTGSLLLLIHR